MTDIVIGRSEKDVAKYGTEGTVWIGKQYIKMGNMMSLANRVLLDVVRPHVILVCGKRGEGKCLSGDTKIVLSNGEVKTIQELVNDKNEVLSLNNNLKITTSPKENFYVREVKEMLEITTLTGKKIKVTPEHPLLTIKGWENACNLMEGSKIATPKIISIFGNEYMSKKEIKKLIYLLIKKKIKHLPNKIFKLPKYKISFLLNELFGNCGTIHKEKKSIKLTLFSEELASQISHLLLRFGIISIINYNKINYELIIKENYLQKFIQEIGLSKNKEIQLLKMIKKNSKEVSNLDIISKELLAWYNSQTLENEQTISGEKSLQKINLEICREIKLLAESDIFWDEIIQIRKLNGNFLVYDISVPAYHNFIANDIIVHNSYTMSMIGEGIVDLPQEIAQNIASLFLDTMGIFWTMKYPNYREEALLASWNLSPKGFDNVKVFVPGGKFEELKDQGIPVDEKFYLTTSELGPLEWCMTFELKPTEPIGILISKTITKLQESKEKYEIDNIIDALKKDEDMPQEIKLAAITRFQMAKEWGLFAKEGTPLTDILKGGQASVLDISIYSHIYGAFSIRALVIALFSKKILETREAARKIEEKEDIDTGFAYFIKREAKKKEIPLIWIFIDEVHEFLPEQGETLATGPLLQIIREGRQPGISLVVATQQPGKMNTDVLSQCDLVISHRVTSKMDIEALNTIMQSYMTSTLSKLIDELPRVKGVTLILDQNQERLYQVQMKPKLSWHGGETPTAIPPKVKEL